VSSLRWLTFVGSGQLGRLWHVKHARRSQAVRARIPDLAFERGRAPHVCPRLKHWAITQAGHFDFPTCSRSLISIEAGSASRKLRNILQRARRVSVFDVLQQRQADHRYII